MVKMMTKGEKKLEEQDKNVFQELVCTEQQTTWHH